jgi:PAS domain S-box-containing protein
MSKKICLFSFFAPTIETMRHPAIPYDYPETSDLLEKALSILQDAIVIINNKGKIAYINTAGLQILSEKVSFVPVAGDDFLSFVREDKKEITRNYINKALANESSVFRSNFSLRGTDTWFELGYYPMPEENGVVTHVCIKAKNISDKVLLEKELENQKRIQKNRLIKATLDAQERQRSEIGRELHDNVNQVLTTVKLYNEICLTEEVTNKAMLMKSVQQINFCIETLRSLSKVLSSPNIDEVTLKESIQELVDSVAETRKIAVNFFTYHIHDEKISQDLQTTIYRIAQEQLTNVLKYADASSVDVMLVGTADTIALRIQDNGNGFEPTEKRKGVGITNMISRAATLDGKIELISGPGQGCTLMAEFPLAT